MRRESVELVFVAALQVSRSDAGRWPVSPVRCTVPATVPQPGTRACERPAQVVRSGMRGAGMQVVAPRCRLAEAVQLVLDGIEHRLQSGEVAGRCIRCERTQRGGNDP